MADGRGRSLATRVTPGQASDTRQLVALLDQVAVARPGGVGRPRKRPDSVTADKAYSSKANRAALRARKIVAVIPERSDQKANRANKEPPVDAHRLSTPSVTATAITSNEASTGESTGVAWRPATTSASTRTRPLSTSPKPSTGYAPPATAHHDPSVTP